MHGRQGGGRHGECAVRHHAGKMPRCWMSSCMAARVAGQRVLAGAVAWPHWS